MSDSPMINLNDGNTMPQIGLGVWQAADGDETRQAVRTAIEAGYRMIDTAMVYQNEESVGLGIQDSAVPREELFIVGSSRVDLQACKLEYSIVSPK